MQSTKNIILKGAGARPITLDIFFEDGAVKNPVLIYAHGFNGFKDWGNFDIIATAFAKEGYVFIKFNFSHNGTTPAQPEVFADLEAFGENNYSKELEDLTVVTDWVSSGSNPYGRVIDENNLSLMGHSMGGGIAILHTASDDRIKKLITWAAISECKTPWGNWPEEKMREWKLTGVQYYTNSRTKQEMPLYYQLYEDYVRHKDQLNIREAIQRILVPVLICHGELDFAVPVEKAFELKQWQPAAKLFILETDHVFGRSHPWTKDELPDAMHELIKATLDFLK